MAEQVFEDVDAAEAERGNESNDDEYDAEAEEQEDLEDSMIEPEKEKDTDPRADDSGKVIIK